MLPTILSKFRRNLIFLFATVGIFATLYYALVSSGVVTRLRSYSPMSISSVLTHTSNVSNLAYSAGAVTTTPPVLAGRAVYAVPFNASLEPQSVRDTVAQHDCVRLRVPGEATKICVHPRAVDVYVSGSLISSGMWEGELVQVMQAALGRHAGMVLVDLGCNIGTFTLTAARAGHRVVAVDASKENLLLLSRSVAINQLQQRVTMFWNALSDLHETVILKGYPENKGGTYVQPSNTTDPTVAVHTIMLDDLIPYLNNDHVFIKMDVETYEWRVINGGRQFFQSTNVGYMLMEFSSHKKLETGQKICDFMSGLGFKPYGTGAGGNNILDIASYQTWPNNVLWSKF